MDSVAVLDILSFLSFGAALICAFLVPESVLDVRSRRLLMVCLGVYVFVSVSNVLEHTGLTSYFDLYEDYAEILFLPAFLIYVYSVMIQRESVRREQSESALRSSEFRHRVLLNTLPDMIFRMDSSGTFIDFKAGIGLGPAVPPEEFIGKNIRTLMPGDLSREVLALMGRAFAKEGVQSLEYRLPAEEGERCYEARIVASGEAEVTAVVRDITDQKQAEEALRKAKVNLERQYEELKKIDLMKDSLIRDVSHELKTPVAKHAMQLEVLMPILGRHKLADREVRALRTMEQSIQRQQSVIRNLLDLARLEGGQRAYLREPVGLDEVLEKVRADYQDLAERCGVDLVLDVPPVRISSDREMLWHLFSNLVNNAIKFRKKEGPAKVEVTAGEFSGEVIVRIADQGIGLSEEEKELIFERFYQGTASSEGSGVGLTICRMIVEGLGGRILVSSEGRGRGTEVAVFLPKE